MLTSNNSLSGDSTKSSGSISDLGESRFHRCFDDEKSFAHTLNDEYVSFTGSGKDERYWERRRKNNAAAKRSRERRRQHDKELEQEIQKLNAINASLREEVRALSQKLALYKTLKDPSDSYTQSYEDISTGQLSPTASKSPSIASLPYLSKESVISTNESFTFLSNICMEELIVNKMSNSRYQQNPLDLSGKMKETKSTLDDLMKSQPKTINRVTMDQKYWDRRRRNNEAVRKCRQNKRAKTVHNGHQSRSDSKDMEIKIQTIASELEKIKSQFKNSELSSLNLSLPLLTAETEESRPQATKILKWKTKLIKADLADKEMC